MKAIFCLVTLLFVSKIVISQENPEKGSKNSLEAGINLQVSPNIAPTIRYRRFVSNHFSLRAGVEVSMNRGKSFFYEDEAGNAGLEGVFSTSNSFSALNIGVAYHLKGNDRLSPYIGVDLIGGMGFLKEVGLNTDGYVFANDYEIYRNSRFIEVGGRLLFGMDYQFYKNAFIGFEGGFIFSQKNYVGINQAITMSGVTVNTYENDYSTMNFTNGGVLLRMGFKF